VPGDIMTYKTDPDAYKRNNVVPRVATSDPT